MTETKTGWQFDYEAADREMDCWFPTMGPGKLYMKIRRLHDALQQLGLMKESFGMADPNGSVNTPDPEPDASE